MHQVKCGVIIYWSYSSNGWNFVIIFNVHSYECIYFQCFKRVFYLIVLSRYCLWSFLSTGIYLKTKPKKCFKVHISVKCLLLFKNPHRPAIMFLHFNGYAQVIMDSNPHTLNTTTPSSVTSLGFHFLSLDPFLFFKMKSPLKTSFIKTQWGFVLLCNFASI